MALDLQRAVYMWPAKKSGSLGALLVLTVILQEGCTTNKTTNPARTATEQLLLSTATDRALGSVNMAAFTNRSVFLDTTYFDSYDSRYVIGTIRDALSRAGARLEDNVTNSDVIIEARSGALSIDSSDTFFGIPNMGVPIPLAGALQTPEVGFYKCAIQRSTAKIALLAFAKESGAHVYSSGPLDGKSYHKHYNIFFVSWIRTDIPEKQKNEKQGAEYQGWFPQYDLMNFPATNATTKRNPVNSSPGNVPMTNLPAAGPASTNASPLAPMNTNSVGM